jgi:hypothetical protein
VTDGEQPSSDGRAGWPHAFVEKDWVDVRDRFATAFARYRDGIYLVDILDTVVANGFMSKLALTTSMHDLVIVDRPIPTPPFDVLIVRAPTSNHPPREGNVLIEYLAVSNRNAAVERPAAEAVPLFWRFVQAKLGISPPVLR